MTFCSIATNLVKIFINFLKRGMFPHEQSVMIKKCVSLHKFFLFDEVHKKWMHGFLCHKICKYKGNINAKTFSFPSIRKTNHLWLITFMLKLIIRRKICILVNNNNTVYTKNHYGDLWLKRIIKIHYCQLGGIYFRFVSWVSCYSIEIMQFYFVCTPKNYLGLISMINIYILFRCFGV